MAVWRGGRGVKAPYETTHVRIPTALKHQVEELSKAYKDGSLIQSKEPQSIDELAEIARAILKQKKSARASLEKFIKEVYGQEVSL